MSSSSNSSGVASLVDPGIDVETFLHLTPLAVGSWRSGERFVVPDGRQSFYWCRLFSADGRSSRIEQAKAANPASAEVVGERDYLLSCLKELLFESVRTSVDPSLPSRSECMFLFERIHDPFDCSARLRRSKTDCTILELRPVVGSRLFRARSSLLDVPVFVPEMVTAAEEYWRGLAPGAPVDDVEVLFTGAFEIVRVVSVGAGPQLTIEGKTFADLFRSSADPAGSQPQRARPERPLAVNDGRTR